MQTAIVVFGIGSFAALVSRYLGDSVYAHTVDAAYCGAHNIFMGKPVIEFEKLQHTHPPSHFQLMFAVTQQNGHRDLLKRKYEQAKDKGYTIATYIHPTAYVEKSVHLDEGVLVSPCAIIEAQTNVGICVHVRSGACIGHDCLIENFAYIAPRASVSSHSLVGENAFIGNNATMRDNLRVGNNAIVGAGAVVLRDVKENEAYKAIEARLLSVDARKVTI